MADNLEMIYQIHEYLHYEAITRYANDIIILADENLNIVEVNERAVQTYGYSRAELLAMNAADLRAPEKKEEIIKTVFKLDPENKAVYETCQQCRNGGLLPVEVSASTLSVKGKKFHLEIIRDISERKRNEEKLKTSSTLLTSVFDGILEPLLLVDGNLRVVMFNKAAWDYFKPLGGLSIGMNCLDPGRFPAHHRRMSEAVSWKTHTHYEQESPVDPEWTERIFVYPLEGTKDTDGVAILRIHDMSSEIKFQEELIQADKLIALGTLVAGVAHEVNNPNNYIMLNAPILAEAWQSISPVLEEYHKAHGDFSVAGLPFPEIRQEIPALIKGIEDGAKRIKRIVQDLREYSVKESTTRFRPENVNRIIDKAAALLNHKIKHTTDHFHTDFDENLPKINADFRKLEQVIINLIQNALEALPDRSKGVSLKTSYNPSENRVTIEVRDQGIGIPENKLNQIMDPFFTTKRSMGGTGLGLAVTRNIIERHHGTITVATRENQGTVFTLSFPAIRPVEHKKILIVDDDPKSRKILRAFLEGNPIYKIREAQSGTEACILLGSERPDILFLDLMMPDMNGLEVCRVIKRESTLADIRVIIVTGNIGSPLIKEIRELGYSEVMAKPVRKAELEKQLRIRNYEL